MKIDYHVHSEFSHDCETPMEVVVNRGIDIGLSEICFTDHVDYGIKQDWCDNGELRWAHGHLLMNVNYPEYFGKLFRMQRLYGNRISIKSGLELGVQTHTIPLYKSLVEKYKDNLDFLLLSMHQVDDLEFWTQDFQKGKTQIEYNLRYYQEILDVINNFHEYSVLAHLDMLSRYDMNGVIPFEYVRDIIAEILKVAILDNKGLEINTASWYYGLSDTQPCRNILKLYRDLGGEIITIGSDAHSPQYLGDHFDDAIEILRDEIGFSYYCTFSNRVPEYHKL